MRFRSLCTPAHAEGYGASEGTTEETLIDVWKPSLEPLLSLKPLAKIRAIVAAAVLALGGAGVTIHYWATEPVALGSAHVVEVSGRITEVVTVDGKHSQLRIWIEGREHPFCVTGDSRALLPADIIERLQRAETAVIAVERDEIASPRRNYREGLVFREIRMLSLDGAPAVTLEASSKQISERHHFVRVVAPAIAAFSAICLGIGLRERWRFGVRECRSLPPLTRRGVVRPRVDR